MPKRFNNNGIRRTDRTDKDLPTAQYPFVPEIAKRLAHLERQDDGLSSFTIAPQAPFGQFATGLVIRSADRRLVILLGPQAMKRIYYARYLYSAYLWAGFGVMIPPGLVVDHIDNNAKNDIIQNFQLLTAAENIRKSAACRGYVLAIMVCPICRQVFSRDKADTQRALWREMRVCCCSLACQRRFHSIRLDPTLKFRKQSEWVSHHQILYLSTIYGDDKYTTPRCEITEFGPRDMLSKDWVLRDDDGTVIDVDKPRYLPLMKKLLLIREYKNKGVTDSRISNILKIPLSTIRGLLYGVR